MIHPRDAALIRDLLTYAGMDEASAARAADALLSRYGSLAPLLEAAPEDLADARARRETDWEAAENVAATEQAGRIREKLGLTGTVVPVRVYVADLDADALREYVTDGAIDPDRLDSGEQVLVYAPNVCVKQEEDTFFSDFMQYGREIREEDWDLVIRNDAFTAGMKLSLLELASTDPEALEYGYDTAEPDWKAYYESMEAVRAETTVGAVLSGPALINGTYPYSFAVIVSPKGAQAMGLKLPNPEYMDVYLSGDPTKAEEQEIDNSLRQIAMRGSMSVDNRLELTRAYMAKKLRQILLFAALILLFFAVSVFMQVNGTARQIRSETRTIGTLRAVGADLKTLVGCYSLPVWICAAAALVPCLLFYAVTRIPGLRLFTENHPLVIIPVLCVLAACVALACIAGIRGRLAGVTRQSTVENIREL